MTTVRPRIEFLYHYFSEFNAHTTMASFGLGEQEPTEGLVTNFIGVKIPVKIHPPMLAPMEGQIEPMPDPGNWHADIAEWGAALRSVEQAKDSYRIVEVGCGWGCWLVNMGFAARARGLDVQMIGIEGDKNHLVNAAEVLELNGFAEDDYSLHHGVAGPKPGKALFPDPEAGTAEWGGQAIFYPDDETLARAEADETVQVLDCKPLEELSEGEIIDLLHIDIQGAEVDYITGNQRSMGRYVRRVLIGTHSRPIEGQLIDKMQEAGWLLELERPAIAPPVGGRAHLQVDGVQLWANPGLI